MRLLLLLIFIPVILKAQPPLTEIEIKVDSIQQKLKTETNDIEYIKGLRAWDNLIYNQDQQLDFELLIQITERCEKKLKTDLPEEDLSYLKQEYGNSLNDLGIVYKAINNYDKALEISFKALKYQKKNNTPRQIAASLNNIGILYSLMEDSERAIKYFDQIINTKDTTLNEIKGDAFNNKGQELTKSKKYTEALSCLNQSLRFYDANNNYRKKANTYNIIGRTYLDLNKIDSAQHYINKGLVIHLKKGNTIGVSGCYNALAKIEFNKAHYHQAIALANKTINLTRNSPSLSRELYGREILLKCFKALKQPEKALKQLEMVVLLRDSLSILQNKDLAFQMDIQYEYEKKTLTDSLNTIKNTELLNQVHRQSIDIQKRKSLLAYVFICIIIILAFIIWIAYKQKKSSNLLLSKKNVLIEQSLIDKELFMKEIHHRVKNNMQMVSSILQLKSTESNNPSVKKELLDSQSRIHSMSLAHKKMYEDKNYKQLNISTYAKEIITTVFSSHKNKKLDAFDFRGDDLLINVEQGQAVGFIIHELALNSVKYAWKEQDIKKITVSILKEKDSIRLTYSDNGRGLPSDFNIDTVTSMGLKLVRSFTQRQLKGKISFLSENGTTVTLTFTPKI